jgi:hypothetical protein
MEAASPLCFCTALGLAEGMGVGPVPSAAGDSVLADGGTASGGRAMDSATVKGDLGVLAPLLAVGDISEYLGLAA